MPVLLMSTSDMSNLLCHVLLLQLLLRLRLLLKLPLWLATAHAGDTDCIVRANAAPMATTSRDTKPNGFP